MSQVHYRHANFDANRKRSGASYYRGKNSRKNYQDGAVAGVDAYDEASDVAGGTSGGDASGSAGGYASDAARRAAGGYASEAARKAAGDSARATTSGHARATTSGHARHSDNSRRSRFDASSPNAPLVRPVGAHAAAEKDRKGGIRRIIFIVSLIVFVCAISALIYIGYTYWSEQNKYDTIAQEVFSVTDTESPTLADFNVDWDALAAINSDIVGWVYVPNSVVNYPIVHRAGDDTYYLYRNFSGETQGAFGAEYGCVFLSGINAAEMTDRVNILYGHNMMNGSMFALFASFQNSDVFNENRYAYVLTPNGNYKLNAFAVNKVLGTSTDIAIANFNTEEEFQAYVQARLDNSIVSATPAAPSATEIQQVFAFSTCDGADDSYRIVTFYTVEEYLPAGSDTSQSNSLIGDSDMQNIEDATTERTTS